MSQYDEKSPQARGLSDGERKFATVLFADIVDSSGLVGGADPEDANDRLLPLLQLMVDSVQRYGGTVTQVLGDGVMALFGAPLALEHHATRACLAAQDIRHRSIDQLGDGKSPMIRIGISSGTIVTQPMRRGHLTEYRAVGDTVHLAARAEEAAAPGEIVITEYTYRLISDQIDVRPAASLRLSKASKPVQTYDLQDVKLAKRHLRQALPLPNDCFVGRLADLAALQQSLTRARRGHGETLVLTGDAGIGKSRLLMEFLGDAKNQGIRVHQVDLEPAEVTHNDKPIAKLVKDLLDDDFQDAADGNTERIAGRLKTSGVRGKHALSAALEILGIAHENRAWRGIDPPERLRLKIAMIADLVRAMGLAEPLILVFEDFHWAGSEIKQLGAELAARVRGAGVQMILTSRSHHDHPWSAWPRVIEHDVEALSPTDTARFIETLLGGNAEHDALSQLLIEKTQGNPLFIEECVRALAERGTLRGEPGAYRLAVPVHDVEIPATVHGLLAERIDTLVPADRLALLCAAVVGRSFDIGLLEQLLPKSSDDLLNRLKHLEEQGFIRRTRIVPNVEFAFRHALIHEVAYGTLLKKSRLRLHARVMRAIERRTLRKLPVKAELLAHHAFCAEDWPKAAAYCRHAGRKAQAMSRNLEAVGHFRRALHAQEHLEDSPRNAQRGIDIRVEAAQSFFPLGENDEAYDLLSKAYGLAEALGDKRRMARATSQKTLFLWINGDLSEALETGHTTLELARKLGDKQLEILATLRLGALAVDRGDFERACKLHQRNINELMPANAEERFGSLVVAGVGCRASLSRALGELGRFKEALELGDEAIRISEEIGHAFSIIYAHLAVANALLRKGEFDRSIPLLELCNELSRSMHADLLRPLSAASLGYAYVRAGDIDKGLSMLSDAVGLADREVFNFQFSQQMTWLAEAYLRAGQAETAVNYANQALRNTRKNGERGDEAWVLWVIGEIESELPKSNLRKAQNYYTRALAIAQECQMNPLIAHCLLALSRVDLTQDKRTSAKQRLQEAIEIYHRLGMKVGLSEANALIVGQGDVAAVSLP